MRKKILVVDDDPEILGMIEYVLKEEGYAVVKSADTRALTKLDKIKPDVILLDCWLPEGFGDDLCRDLKSHAIYQHIPIILISAVHNLEFLARQCKADAFIEKPFDIEHLTAMVKRYVS